MAGKPPALDIDQRRDCIERFQRGLSIHQVSLHHGVHHRTVRRVLEEAGLVARPKHHIQPRAEPPPPLVAEPTPVDLDGDELKAEARRRILTWTRETLDSCEAISRRIAVDAVDPACPAQHLRHLANARQSLLDQLEQLRRMAGDLVTEAEEVHRVVQFAFDDEGEDE